ncbi:hypothetical protein HMPREF1092_00996 [Clostridium thermobutyricum]|uniref:DUF4044 domain-containing protein n=2 Tax=Clostridium thermobutyricum TaxID=29372 RepID=N9Y1S1_9CLOT|nr:hypothetical protein HMPREF1092_00996 [Clostridium thermobutyricum]OPX51255.1 hypothetical protein CLTHE_00430 [Clostridium thermobutyricum DSM 4928]
MKKKSREKLQIVLAVFLVLIFLMTLIPLFA